MIIPRIAKWLRVNRGWDLALTLTGYVAMAGAQLGFQEPQFPYL